MNNVIVCLCQSYMYSSEMEIVSLFCFSFLSSFDLEQWTNVIVCWFCSLLGHKWWKDFVHAMMWTWCESILSRDHFFIDLLWNTSDRIDFDRDLSSGGNDEWRKINENSGGMINEHEWNGSNLSSWFGQTKVSMHRRWQFFQTSTSDSVEC